MYLWGHSSASAARLLKTGPNSLVSPASRLARIRRWKFRHMSLCRCHQMRRRRCLRPRRMSLQRDPRERSTDLRESTLSADTPLADCWTCGRLSNRRQTCFEISLSDTSPSVNPVGPAEFFQGSRTGKFWRPFIWVLADATVQHTSSVCGILHHGGEE